MKKLVGLLLTIFLFMGSVAAGGITVSPVSLDKSGNIDIINNGNSVMNYEVSFSQVLLKDGTQIIVDNVKPDIKVSESSFKLAPGQTKTISVDIGDTGGLLYGIRITGKPDGVTEGITLGVSAIVKIPGQISNAIESLDIVPKFLPIGIGGVPVTINYDTVNNGNVPVAAFNKTLYPGDSINIPVSYDTGFLDFGIKEYPEGVKVFIIPSPLLIIVLLVGVVLILRRKIDISIKK